MVHTPRLCIDGRAAAKYPVRGLIAQEVIDQLVAAGGEPDVASEWIDRRRIVLLTHRKQVFSGQLRRFDTRVGLSRSPLHWLWEKRFVRDANISAFHRFRPADQLFPRHGCHTFTTVLPPKTGLPFFVSRRSENHYIVPSRRDAGLLEKGYHVPANQVSVVRPSVRRYVHFTERPKAPGDGTLLLLTGGPGDAKDLRKLTSVISDTFPHLPRKTLSLRRESDVTPVTWAKHLEGVQLCFYLNAPPFDWATLALEALFWGIPTIFLDRNATLAEILPHSPLKLSRFLVDQPDLAVLRQEALQARESLLTQGIFAPLSLAKQYTEIYKTIPISREFAEETAPVGCAPCQST